MRGRLEQAQTAWSDAAANCPDPDERSWVYWRAMDTLLRKGHAKEALDLMPQSGVTGENLLMFRASAYSRLGMRDALIEVVDEAIARDYSFPTWARYKAQRAWLMGDRDAAAEILQRHVEAHPANVDLLAMLADFLQHMGQGARAVHYARQANAIRPVPPVVLRIVVRVLWANHRYLEALGIARRPRVPGESDR